MIHEISILIPTRNEVCLPQVQTLQQLASSVQGLEYEIIVSDDASTNQEVIQQNSQINEIEHCKLLLRDECAGRAANRNFLAHEAKYNWLLFLDCNVKIPNKHFLSNYLETDSADVVNGGIFAETDKSFSNKNLRYMYEKKIEPRHTAQQRQKNPYKSFRTSNFMVRRNVMLDHSLDETVPGYGYEDVLWGKTLCENNIRIEHIDNPVVMTHFEDNEKYVTKVEEAMRTLYALRDELSDYSPLLNTVNILQKKHLATLFKQFFKNNAQRLRKNLTGASPSIRWLNVYKLWYYLSISDEPHK